MTKLLTYCMYLPNMFFVTMIKLKMLKRKHKRVKRTNTHRYYQPKNAILDSPWLIEQEPDSGKVTLANKFRFIIHNL